MSWIAPPEGVIKVNTDEAKASDGHSSAAGVFRNREREWLRGFDVILGSCSLPIDELWGVVHGLKLA